MSTIVIQIPRDGYGMEPTPEERESFLALVEARVAERIDHEHDVVVEETSVMGARVEVRTFAHLDDRYDRDLAEDVAREVERAWDAWCHGERATS